MAVRGVQNEIAGGAVMTMNIIATAQGVVEADDIVVLSTSSNWAANTCSARDSLKDAGIVRKVSDDSKLATVQFFHYNSCVKLEASTAVPLGTQVYTASTTGGYMVVTSAISGDENVVVAASSTDTWVLFR